MAFLQGKKILITGLLSNRSIAYGIAKACHREGAELAFTYVGERFKDRITEFAAEFGSSLGYDCDVGSDEQIDALFADLAKSWPQLDGLVHAIGFAPREAIAGEVPGRPDPRELPHRPRHLGLQLPGDGQGRAAAAEGWFVAADPVLPGARSVRSLTTTPWAWPRPRWKRRYATWRKTWASWASAPTASPPARSRPWPRPASGLRQAAGLASSHAPLRRNVTIEEVGNTAAFMLSDLASGITGEITYVDGGFSHVMGLNAEDYT